MRCGGGAFFLISIILFLTAAPAFADAAADQARNEARAEALYREVRCIQCQSESIADSNAPIAADMRRAISEDIAAGKSDDEIRAKLVARYSDYVLFRPKISTANLLLWFLPPLIAILGGLLLFLRAKKQAPSIAYGLTTEEDEKLRQILNKDH